MIHYGSKCWDYQIWISGSQSSTSPTKSEALMLKTFESMKTVCNVGCRNPRSKYDTEVVCKLA